MQHAWETYETDGPVRQGGPDGTVWVTRCTKCNAYSDDGACPVPDPDQPDPCV